MLLFGFYLQKKTTDKCHKNCAKSDNIELLLFAFSIVAVNLRNALAQSNNKPKKKPPEKVLFRVGRSL